MACSTSPWRVRVINGNCADCGTPYEYKIPKGFAPPTRCEACIERRNAKDDSRRRERLARELIANASIPDRYLVFNGAIADKLNGGDLLEWITARLGRSLWVGGSNGIGKTHTLCFVAVKAILERPHTCRLVRASEWLRRVAMLRTGDRNARIQAETLVRDVSRVDLVILDDIGKERLTETRAECLYDLIDERERNERPIWVTSNFSGAVLLRRLNDAGEHGYGDAILARLKRMIKPEDIWKGEK